MFRAHEFQMAVWLYRASLAWPTADGLITRIDIERRQDTRGHYFCPTFNYDFRDDKGCRVWEVGTRIFQVKKTLVNLPRENCRSEKNVVRFNPKNPAFNSLELDSWTYSGDRPASLPINRTLN